MKNFHSHIKIEKIPLADFWIKYVSGQGQWLKGWWAFQIYGLESQVCRRSKRLFLLSVQRWYPFTFFCFLIFRKRLCSVLGRAQGSNASVEAGRGPSPRQGAGGHALQHEHHHQDLSRVWSSCSSRSSGVCSEGSPLGTAGGRCDCSQVLFFLLRIFLLDISIAVVLFLGKSSKQMENI